MQEEINKELIGSINNLTNTIHKLTSTIALGYDASKQKEPKRFVHMKALSLETEKINQGLQHKQVKDLLHLFGQNEILDLPTDKVAYFCAELAQLEPITSETVRALATAKVKEGIIEKEVILGFLEQAKAPKISDLSEKDLLELNTWLKEVKPVNKKLDNL